MKNSSRLGSILSYIAVGFFILIAVAFAWILWELENRPNLNLSGIHVEMYFDVLPLIQKDSDNKFDVASHLSVYLDAARKNLFFAKESVFEARSCRESPCSEGFHIPYTILAVNDEGQIFEKKEFAAQQNFFVCDEKRNIEIQATLILKSHPKVTKIQLFHKGRLLAEKAVL